ncbi:FtsX-like permease family protein [Sansalvadorimonas sp. 2012CJ34-2]|uniref:FtsX-like permease family protein n=1 Tax=Parendozoicomonas callyspongiae TaxID=2942213 RepID=A0ABT0PG19_9GAMM|nr:FtsX-like permease family protein [Sansalvadorimonas sp. 2012CJ34-2]MCL6270320.1 FtsX-like permease family protein [Sansalvadorimonas sp. 2012CJ34-2]
MRQSWRFLVRDWRSGELWLLVLSLLMAIAVSTAIALFSDRLQLALGRQVAEVLGADLMIRSPRPLKNEVTDQARSLGLQSTTVLEFPSVVLAGEDMHLVSAKAVQEAYPLRGYMRAADQPFTPDRQISDTPKPGEAWLEPRLFPLLNVKIGDQVQLGETELTITRSITLETDRGGDFYSLSPRLLFNMADVEKTEIIQPGSRVNWKTLFAGDNNQLQSFRKWTDGKLESNERLVMADDSRRDLRNSVVRLRQFLGLASMAAILLAGVAVAMASRRFAERRFDTCAVMRCVGASRKQVVSVLLGELFLVALLVTLPGVLLGWGLQAGVVSLLKGVLPAWLPEAGFVPMLVGGATGIITLAGFGLAPLLRLHGVSPLRVLRRELTPAPPASWLVYTLSLVAMAALLWYHTGELVMTVIIVLTSGIVLMAVSMGIQALLLGFSRRAGISSIPYSWRLGLRRIVQERGKTSAQLLAFSLTFMAMAIVLVLRTDLFDRWQDKLPEDTPNYFAINIQPSEVDEYREFLDSNGIDSSELYPIVRGRLVKINGEEVRKAVSKEQRLHNSLNRELNLTWSPELPDTNKLIEGRWWKSGSKKGLSVEQELAENLGIKMGDQLTFMVSGQEFSQAVTSIRQVEWESFQPNFYMIFPEAVLEELPATWLNSFYLPEEDKVQLNALITSFPTMTLLDLDSVIGQVRKMLAQSTLAVEAMLFALLVAGLLVLASVIESSIDERLQEGALIRSLGGTRRQLILMQAGEFILFGGLSGVLAVVGAEFCSYWLNTRVFELNWQPAYWMWISLPVAGATVIGTAGWMGVRRVIRRAPVSVLSAV